MKAISCPQCGSLIRHILPHQPIAGCDYCGAKVITDGQFQSPEPFDEETAKFRAIENYVRPKTPTQPIFIGISLIGAFAFVLFIAALIPTKSRSSEPIPRETYKPIVYPTIAPISPKVEDDKLFGGKGTSAGLFDGANQIAVDKAGNVYVADSTLRVQRFDANGKFLNLWNVKGSKNETIDKLAASANGEIDVLIGGEIVVFKGETGEQLRVLTDSRRHYIDDFVLLDDGGTMYVAENGGREEFVQIKGRAIVNRFAGILTNAADAKIPTAGIKIAVDGKDEIFAVYAIMSLEGTSEYNEEDLMTFHFARNGKFVNKFAAGLMPHAIAIDSQSRAYVLDGEKIAVYSSSGESVGVRTASFTDAFALDDQNNIYTISNETVRKLKPVDFRIE